MSKKFLSGINVTGTATLNTVADAGSNTDKFLVLDASNNVSYRTAAELYIDLGIGSTAAAYTSTLKHEVKASQTIGKGQAVYVSSADGTNMIVSKASNVSEQYSSKTMGLLETSLVANGKGNVITEGLLSGLNTNGANAGDPVWLGVDGALIFGLANKPYAPAHLVFIGIVTRANANNGEIFVKVQNGFEMNELHNYQEGSVQNNQVIVYESSTSLYKPKTIPTILGYTPVPDSRTITINGTSYDLTANRAWTITTDASARTILRYVATANQTTFTISGGYTPGLTDVYRNGVKLDNSTDFTATNGTTIVLTNGASVNDVIEVYRYQTAFLANNALRAVTEFITTAGQTTFSVTYNSGLVDVFYNGSKLLSTEYTASNGTSIVLNFPCNLNDTLEVHAYSYQVGAFFNGQAQLNGTGLVRMSGTTVSYDNATYATQSYVTTAVANLVNSAPTTLDTLNELATALGNDANFANTITTSISTKQSQLNGTGFVKVSGTTVSYDNSTYLTTSAASSTYLPLTGGTLTGALSGTSATFSGDVAIGVATALRRLHVKSGAGIAQFESNTTSGTIYFGDTTTTTIDNQGIGSRGNSIAISAGGLDRLTISSNGAATFSSSIAATSATFTQSAAASVFVNSTSTSSYSAFVFNENGTPKTYLEYINSTYATADRRNYLEAFNIVGGFSIYTANVKALDINTSQIATFSSSVNTGSWLGVPNGFGITGRNAANTAGRILIMINSGNQIEIGRDSDISQIRMGTAAANDALTIASNGAATFSSSLSVPTATISSSITSPMFRVTPTGTFRVNTNGDALLGYMLRSGSWKGNTENNLAFATDGPYGISFFTNGSASERIFITTDGNVLINSNSDIGTKLQVNGANYIEMATFACTTGGANTITTDNAGYVQFSYGAARHCSNTDLFVPVTNGIQITKAGILHLTFSQDITTAGTTGYVAAYIRKNGANISENLITNTGGQWDGINGVATINVNASDVIGFHFNAADILSFDPGSWSQYSFIWSAR